LVLAAADRPVEVCVQLPEGLEVLLVEPARNPDEDNCAVEVYYQVSHDIVLENNNNEKGMHKVILIQTRSQMDTISISCSKMKGLPVLLVEPARNPDEDNCAVEVYYQVSHDIVVERIRCTGGCSWIDPFSLTPAPTHSLTWTLPLFMWGGGLSQTNRDPRHD
jgi:hypothetical protein